MMKNINLSSYFKEGAPQVNLLYILMVLVPIYYWYVTPIMIVLGIFFLLCIKRKFNEIAFLSRPRKILFYVWILFYLWQVLGLTYSDHLQEGIRNISLRLPLLLFPLVLISPETKVIDNTQKLLKVFALSTFLYVIVCFTFAAYRSVKWINGELSFNPHPVIDPWLNFFYESQFAIFQHPSYLSMYILFSVFILFEFLISEAGSILKKSLTLIIISILVLSIYLLSSRAALITAVICLPVYFILKLVYGQIRRIWWAVLILVSSVMIVFMLTNPRFNKLVKTYDKNEILAKSKKEARIGLWQAGINLFFENLILGVGTGDVQKALDNEYCLMRRNDLVAVKQLNAHNQFIEIAAEHGLVGLSLFMSIFILMLIIAISDRNVIYLMFIFISIISLIFETMFNRLAGLSFLSIFSFLLIHGRSKKPV